MLSVLDVISLIVSPVLGVLVALSIARLGGWGSMGARAGVLWRKVADCRQVVTASIRSETWGVCECARGVWSGAGGTVGYARKLARREQWS